jgi:hypothetical protein
MNASALDLARHRQEAAAGGELDPMALGEVFAASGFFEDATDTAKAVVKILAGREMGLGPMAAMTGINIIEGKPSLSANLLAAQVKRSAAYDYIPREVTERTARIEFFQGGESVGFSEFNLAEAERAGLTRKTNFQRYPSDMLFARALSRGVRRFCPDVTAGSPAYVPEELGGEDLNAEAPPVERPPEEPLPPPSPIEPRPEPPDPEPEPLPPAAEEEELIRIEALDAEGVRQLGRMIGRAGLGFNRLCQLFGVVGADGPRENSSASIGEALAALDLDTAVSLGDLIEAEPKPEPEPIKG